MITIRPGTSPLAPAALRPSIPPGLAAFGASSRLSLSPLRWTARMSPTAASVAQDVALSALLGGNLFGRVAMHPALAKVSDPSERGKVLNSAWRRYGTVNSIALVGLIAGWIPQRRDELGAFGIRRRDRSLVLAKDVTVGAVVVTGIASAIGGIGFAREAPEAAVPMATGRDPAPETPTRAARMKRTVNVLARLNLVAELALLGTSAALAQARSRRLLRR